MTLKDIAAAGPLFNLEPKRPEATPMGEELKRDAGWGEALARGVCRTLGELGHGTLVEFRVGKGRRVDVMALDKDGLFTVIEVKSSVADFRADNKWWEYLPWTDAFYFAVDKDFPVEILPGDAGLMIADSYGAEIVRPSSLPQMNANRRRAQIIRFGVTASRRLRHAVDPRPF